MVKLSVVVPFHNVEDYIEAALESIARQTFRDLEVIVVDDGSTDGSTVIAKTYVASDPRFRLVQQENAGLGPARNTGVRHATGDYLAFVDSDDVLDPHAYELLIKSLEQTGSDIATAGVTRFNTAGPLPSWLHDEPFRKTRLRTHASKFPVLLQDRTAWNKVFRRSFWDTHSFEFPGTFYEDGPVVLRAHVLASAVDVIQDVVYYWRVRDAGALSITQRVRELANVEQRMASLHSVSDFLSATAPALKPIYDQSVVKGDIGILLKAFEFATETDRARIAELAAGYLRAVDPSVFSDVPPLRRLQCHLLQHGLLPELLEVLRYERRGEVPITPLTRRAGREARWCARYPFFRDPTHGIPDDVYDITGEMTLRAELDQVFWDDGKLRIKGNAYIRWLSSATPSECEIRVTLRNARIHRTLRLPVKRVRRPDVTAKSGQGVCYDWSGFEVEVSPQRLATLPGVWRAANWELMVEVSGGGLRLQGPVTKVLPGSAQWPAGAWINDTVWIQPAPEQDGRFMIRGQQVNAFVTQCAADEDSLAIAGWADFPVAPDAKVVVRPRKGGIAPVRVPAQAVESSAAEVDGRNGRHAFRARLPLRELIIPRDAASPIDRVIHAHDEFTWDVYINPGGGKGATRLAITLPATGARLAHGGREITAFVTHFGFFSLLERTVRPVVTDLDWTSSGRLNLRGDYSDPAARPQGLVLRHAASGRAHTLPLTWEGSVFRTTVTPSGIPGIAGETPLASGVWQLLAPNGESDVPVAAARQLLPQMPGYHTVGLHEVEAQPYHTDALRLHVRTALSDEERGVYASNQLRTRHYPRALNEPIRELAVFDTFGGRQYSCNPRAIYEELRSSHPEIECVWITADGQFQVPDGARAALKGSKEHFGHLARARYLIVNDELPRWFQKRDGQVCLQTWHGTPLKRIGLDIERPQFASALIYRDILRAEAASWDMLLSPNEFSTAIFRSAFGFDGEIVETGYPRNDLLHRPDRESRAAAVRDRLGLAADKRIVLYAPTWRDNAVMQSGGYRFDLHLDISAMADALGDDHTLLLRLHTKARKSLVPGAASSFVVDVTDYPDITDLLLVSDVLITDYSSVMFDFAGSGRPMIFFTYDLESYRDNLRGFYFDFEAEAPGPLLSTTADIVDALRDINNVETAYADAYKVFANKYCGLDDGKASERVVSRLLDER